MPGLAGLGWGLASTHATSHLILITTLWNDHLLFLQLSVRKLKLRGAEWGDGLILAHRSPTHLTSNTVPSVKDKRPKTLQKRNLFTHGLQGEVGCECWVNLCKILLWESQEFIQLIYRKRSHGWAMMGTCSPGTDQANDPIKRRALWESWIHNQLIARFQIDLRFKIQAPGVLTRVRRHLPKFLCQKPGPVQYTTRGMFCSPWYKGELETHSQRLFLRPPCQQAGCPHLSSDLSPCLFSGVLTGTFGVLGRQPWAGKEPERPYGW